jgi:hypothetical protein
MKQNCRQSNPDHCRLQQLTSETPGFPLKALTRMQIQGLSSIISSLHNLADNTVLLCLTSHLVRPNAV